MARCTLPCDEFRIELTFEETKSSLHTYFCVFGEKDHPPLKNTSFPLLCHHSQDKIRGETHQSPWLLSDKLFV